MQDKMTERTLTIAKGIQEGKRRALAQGISIIENEPDQRQALISYVHEKTGRACTVGITGSPGAGKSSLVNMLTKAIRERGLTVGIIAIDPTSPFGTGALLGDRIRMSDHRDDAGVFMRSLATRGSMGGLSLAVRDTIRLFDVYGADFILVETVGTGQTEVDVMGVVDTTVLVLTPGAGDDIQTLKAGIMEIADVFAINKADLDGAQKVAREVEGMLALQRGVTPAPDIVMTTVKDAATQVSLLDAICAHRERLQEGGADSAWKSAQVDGEIREIILETLTRDVKKSLATSDSYRALIEEVVRCRIDPYSAAETFLAGYPTRDEAET